MNKNTIISIFLGLVLITAIGGYFVFYKSGPVAPAPTTETSPDITTAFPEGTDKANLVNNFNSPATSTDGVDSIPSNINLSKIGNLSQIANQAIAGAGNNIYFGTTSEDILYIYRATGHIYQTSMAENNPTRITNTTVPKAEKVWWGRSSKTPVVLIYYTDKNNIGHWWYASVKTSTSSEGELVGSDLDQNITDLDISPDGKNIVYLKKDAQGIVATIFNIDSGKKTPAFRSVFKDWNVSWDNLSNITLISKPAAGVSGLALSLNPQNLQTKTLVDGVTGLTTLLSPDNKKILLSQTSGSTAKLTRMDIDTGEELTLSTPTLPEKCVWSRNNTDIYCGAPKLLPAGTYPDEWYSGELSFNDAIWKINTDTGSTTLLFNPGIDSSDQPIDVYQPFLSLNENYLYLTNKHDLTLWGLDLTQ